MRRTTTRGETRLHAATDRLINSSFTCTYTYTSKRLLGFYNQREREALMYYDEGE